jgi:hypothetical protein
MKKLLNWGTVGFLTTALLDPIFYYMLEQPIPWGRDLLMAVAGIGCWYLLVRFRDSF